MYQRPTFALAGRQRRWLRWRRRLRRGNGFGPGIDSCTRRRRRGSLMTSRRNLRSHGTILWNTTRWWRTSSRRVVTNRIIRRRRTLLAQSGCVLSGSKAGVWYLTRRWDPRGLVSTGCVRNGTYRFVISIVACVNQVSSIQKVWTSFQNHFNFEINENNLIFESDIQLINQ